MDPLDVLNFFLQELHPRDHWDLLRLAGRLAAQYERMDRELDARRITDWMARVKGEGDGT